MECIDCGGLAGGGGRKRESKINFVAVTSGGGTVAAPAMQGAEWLRIRKPAGGEHGSFKSLYDSMYSGKPAPAGILFRRDNAGGIEMHSASTRPPREKFSQLSATLLDGCTAALRTEIIPSEGRVAIHKYETPDTVVASLLPAACGAPDEASLTRGLLVFDGMLNGEFVTAPAGIDAGPGALTAAALLMQLRVPGLACAGTAFADAADSTAQTAALCVSGIEDDGGSLEASVLALAASPQGEASALLYAPQLLDALRLIETSGAIHGCAIEARGVHGLKLGPAHEIYEFRLAVRPAGDADTHKALGAALFTLYEFIQSLIVTGPRRDISVFDLIGPAMIGPSSSHTCGANRIGRLARRVIESMLPQNFDPARDVLCLSARLHNSFRKSGEGHHTLNALAAGLLHDMPQDYAGNEGPALSPWTAAPPEGRPENIAFFDPRPWLDADGAPQLLEPSQISGSRAAIHWTGYHKFDPSKNGADIPLPPGHPANIHENSVAVLAKIVTRESLASGAESEAMLLRAGDREFNWDDFDFVALGESLGGGKVRIRSVGGRLAAASLPALKQSGWELHPGGFALYPPGAGIPPLDGAHADDYPGVANLNPAYPPRGAVKDPHAALAYYDLDSMLEHARRGGKSLLRLALEYETWSLGVKPSADTEARIMSEAAAMLRALDAAGRPFGDIGLNDGSLETDNVIRTYMSLRENGGEAAAALLGDTFQDAVTGSITAMTRNAFSELVLAAPTGGACGVLTGVYLALRNRLRGKGMSEADFDARACEALLVCGFLGSLVAVVVPPSGAEKGCQAETGTAAGMGAAFAAFMLGGSSDSVVNAMILAMKNSLGLVCDPIAGKVNTPCIKRNAFKAVEALLGSWLSLNGIVSFVSPSQVVKAMAEIGDHMAGRYRETSEGGLAKTIDGLKERMCRLR